MLSSYEVKMMAQRERRYRELDIRNAKILGREELLDRKQLREEREQRWEMERKEREVRLANGSLRERILITLTVACSVFALALLFVAVVSGQAYAAQGSGMTGIASVLGWVHLTLRQASAAATAPGESRIHLHRAG